MLNVGGTTWLLLVAWQQILVSPSDIECRHSVAGYNNCRFRWLHPCRGSNSVDLEMEIDDVSDWLRDFDLSQALATLSVKASMLRKQIRSVIDLYVISRIGVEYARELDVSGVGIEGMASFEVNDLNLDLTANIHKVYEHLAKTAVFLSHMIKDDQEATTEHVYFEKRFEKLENELYLILCILTQINKKLETPLSSEIIESILKLKVGKINQNSLRHFRDYLILRKFEKIAEVMSRNFITLERLRRK